MGNEVTEPSPDAPGSASSRRYATDRATLEKEVIIEPYRGPGPGGQRKNRKETAIRLTHTPSGITVIASERRSQAQNREIALQRLIKKLRQLNRPRKRRIPTRPSASAIRKQKEAKQRLSQKKRLRQKSTAPLDLE
ncbi:MAG: peptide chain release factor-like protein [Dehalococcoidia bacterium]|nr:peptide chain release factor-like protein [Dehalococcoidia bacterium]